MNVPHSKLVANDERPKNRLFKPLVQVSLILKTVFDFLSIFTIIILVYTLKLDENMLSDTIGDIVVAHKGQGKGDNDNDGQVSGNDDALEHDSSHAVTNAIALMTIIW